MDGIPAAKAMELLDQLWPGGGSFLDAIDAGKGKEVAKWFRDEQWHPSID